MYKINKYDRICTARIQAGEGVLEVYNNGNFEEIKDDLEIIDFLVNEIEKLNRKIAQFESRKDKKKRLKDIA